MRRQIIFWCVLVLFGAAAGFGSAWFSTKAKINNRETIITDLKGKLQKSESQFQESNAKVLKLNFELAKNRNELQKAREDMRLMTSAIKEYQNREAVSTAPQTPALETAQAAPADEPANVPTVEYTVKANDSFWTIAASQLANGSRYKEIMKLNPDAANRKYLPEGLKLRLPAK